MFCSQCGYMLDENDKFCPKCGEPVKTERTERGPEYETNGDYRSSGRYDSEADYRSGGRYDSEADYRSGGRYDSEADYRSGGRYDSEADYRSSGRYDSEADYRSSGRYDNEPDDKTYNRRKQTGADADAGEQPVRRGEHEDKRRQKQRKAQKKQKRTMLLCAVVAFSAVLVIAALVGFNFYRNYRMDHLKKAYSVYEQTMDEYMVEDRVFTELLLRAQKAIEHRDISSAKSLEKELNEACETIEKTSESRQKLTELKTEYEAVFAKYRIFDDYKEAYDTVMKSLEDAISASDEKQFSTLKKQLESLKINLNTANQQEVTSIKNKITALDVSDADTEDAKRLEDYKTQTESALAEGNYASALEVLESWHEDAKTIAGKIKKEREAKAESMKAEQERLESESESRAEESRKAESEKEAAASGDYILPDSHTRLLTDDDLEDLSANELMLARNEIYARHGRKFVDEQIQAYFNSKSWYSGTVEAADFDSSVLSDIERKNISFISEHE